MKGGNDLRFLSIFLCAAIVACSFFFFAPVASAVGLDYNDYVTNVVVDGDNDRVTVSLPLDQFFWRLTLNGQVTDQTGSSFTYDYVYGNDYYLYLYSPYIDATQIPDDTQIYVTVDFNLFTAGAAWGPPQYFGNVLYSNGETASVSLGKDVYGTAEYTHILDYNGSDSFFLSLGANYFGLATDQYGSVVTNTSRVNSFIMEFSISSLLRLQQTTGKTNKILQAVEDAINNPADPKPPEGSNIITDFDQQEQEILGDANDAWGESQKIFGDFNLSLSTLAVTFGGMSAFLNKLFALPAFQILLSISLAIGVLAAVLNMASSGKTQESDASSNHKGGK